MARYVDAYKIEYEDITDENGDTYMVAHAPQIERLETEDVQPVIHGRWVGDEEYEHMNGYYEAYKCSNCGCGVGYTSKYPYCPECGAKMKNGESEEERMRY